MPNTYITTKSHMNQVWDENGIRKAVTILKTEPGVIVQIKTEETDGYKAIVVGFGSQKESRIKAPQLKSFKKIGLKSFPAMTREIKVETPEDFKVGDTITAEEIFSIGDIVNSQGITKGRGFTGVIKRWGFHGGPRTHGQSDRERAPGSIGQGTDPGRVHRGKKMPGHYGNEIKTIKNLIIANITDDQIWVTGPVPGSIHSKIMLTKVGEKKNYVGLLGLDESDSTPKEEVVDKVKSDKPVEAKQENKEPVKDQKEDSKNESEDKKE